MVRIFSFLVLLAAVALGAAWVADQSGVVVLSWNGWRAETSLPVLALIVLVVVVAAMLVWSIVRAFWKAPARLRRHHHEKRRAKARHAITQGLIAVGTGDSFAAHRHAGTAKRLAENDPLVLLLQAQTAQLEGDRPGAQHAFHAMAEREDMRLLGLRGLFIEAQRNDDPYTAVAMAEEALKIAPSSPWASHAVLGFRCAQGDWDGALVLLDNNKAAGLIDTAPYRRQRGVLLTARALALEERDRDLSRKSAMEAIKFAPQLVPAAVLAAKFYSEDNQVRRAMRTIEVAWNANPHPDLAELAQKLDLGMISHGPARFDPAELESLNARILHAMPYEVALPRLPRSIGGAAWEILRANLQKFADIEVWAKVLDGQMHHQPDAGDREFLAEASELLPPEPWDETTWAAWTNALKAQSGRKGETVLILLTDGSNDAGLMDPLQAAKMAAAAGLRIYTIGVGAAVQQSMFGSMGNTDLDEDTLKSVARITGGEYFRATDADAYFRPPRRHAICGSRSAPKKVSPSTRKKGDPHTPSATPWLIISARRVRP